jgi:exonuclease III
MSINLVSWNIRGDVRAWDLLVDDDALDVALLQEVKGPPPVNNLELMSASENWAISGWEERKFCAAVIRASSRHPVTANPGVKAIGLAGQGELAVSRPGSLAVASIDPEDGGGPIVLASVYCAWERPVPYKEWGYADASAHRILSDLSALLYDPKQRIIVAGDWNILRGYGENGDPWFRDRYQSVFDRAAALGLKFVGPEYPRGRRASPWPEELPPDSACVPTFHHSRQTPTTASRQLDFVFASNNFASCVTATAVNDPDEWGPSDHCRVRINVDI